MAGNPQQERAREALDRAARLATEALDLLDAHGGPPDAAAHLQMALIRLREARGGVKEDSGPPSNG